jgi:hypothetical protein
MFNVGCKMIKEFNEQSILLLCERFIYVFLWLYSEVKIVMSLNSGWIWKNLLGSN